MITEPVLNAAFRTHSLVLSGEIGVNFFMELPEGMDYAGSYMEFTVSGVTVRDDFDPDDRDLNGNGYYGFTCYVNAIQMAEPITAVFHYGSTQTAEQTYSVKDYITAYEAVADNFDASTTALVRALADYGHYAQPVLAEANGWTVGGDYAEMDVFYTDAYDYDAAASSLSPFALRSDLGISDVDSVSLTLNLLSRTELRVIIKPWKGYIGIIKVTVDGGPYEEVDQNNWWWTISVSNIPADKLGDVYRIEIETEEDTAAVQVSALSYAAAAIGPEQPANLRNIAAALYNYYKAAMD